MSQWEFYSFASRCFDASTCHFNVVNIDFLCCKHVFLMLNNGASDKITIRPGGNKLFFSKHVQT
jgi:hypothetical protein